MTGKELLRKLTRNGCEVVRQSGSHAIVRCPGGCQTTVPVHGGRDIPTGTLRAIKKQLDCIDWEDI